MAISSAHVRFANPSPETPADEARPFNVSREFHLGPSFRETINQTSTLVWRGSQS